MIIAGPCAEYMMVFWAMQMYTSQAHSEHTPDDFLWANNCSTIQALATIVLSVYACYCPVAKR